MVLTNCIIMIAADIFSVTFSVLVGSIPASVTAETVLRSFQRNECPRSPGNESQECARQTHTVQNLQLVQTLPIWMHPIYTAVFSQLSARQQLWFSLILVPLRLSVRVLQWRVAYDDEDLAGVISSASGHLFHVLYIPTCLQNAKSTHTLAIMLVFNTLQTLLNCQLLACKSHLPGLRRGDEELSAVMEMLADDNFVRRLGYINPTIVLSTYHRYQDDRFRALHTLPPDSTGEGTKRHKRTRTCCSRRQVVPAESSNGPDSTMMRVRVSSKTIRQASSALVGDGSDPDQVARVVETCERLHSCEAFLLRSYVTTIIILVHGAYITVVFWLPNRRFFLTMEAMRLFEDVQDALFRNAVLYCAKLAFAAVYTALIYRRFAISGVSLLVFVLSSQSILFMAKCISLSLFIFSFPLRKNGNEAILTS